MCSCIEIKLENHFYKLLTLINKKMWEELIAYFPLIRHEPYRKRKNWWNTDTQTNNDVI
jgi:hypothetical protein